jgi:uncharacterized tellurite resistance protein B-like protein
MFGRWLARAREGFETPGAAKLEEAVQAALPAADRETVLMVVAIAGLLGAVAYADRTYSPDEAKRVRAELGRLNGMTAPGAEAVAKLLEGRLVELATIETPRLCRVLRELGDDELRREVLEILVDLAAEDGVITSSESNVLRRLTSSLGLTQDDYNRAQERHKARLAVLR